MLWWSTSLVPHIFSIRLLFSSNPLLCLFTEMRSYECYLISLENVPPFIFRSLMFDAQKPKLHVATLVREQNQDYLVFWLFKARWKNGRIWRTINLKVARMCPSEDQSIRRDSVLVHALMLLASLIGCDMCSRQQCNQVCTTVQVSIFNTCVYGSSWSWMIMTWLSFRK